MIAPRWNQKQCACCMREYRAPVHATLKHQFLGAVALLLCRDCLGDLSWRADDPLLVDPHGNIHAGRAVRTIWRNVSPSILLERRMEETKPAPASEELI